MGPLTNPAEAQAQLVGVYAKELTVSLAEVLKNLGTQIAFVVHGHDGLDEITTTGETQVSALADGKVESYSISPHHFDMQIAKLEDLSGGTPDTNAEITRQI